MGLRKIRLVALRRPRLRLAGREQARPATAQWVYATLYPAILSEVRGEKQTAERARTVSTLSRLVKPPVGTRQKRCQARNMCQPHSR